MQGNSYYSCIDMFPSPSTLHKATLQAPLSNNGLPGDIISNLVHGVIEYQTADNENMRNAQYELGLQTTVYDFFTLNHT